MTVQEMRTIEVGGIYGGIDCQCTVLEVVPAENTHPPIIQYQVKGGGIDCCLQEDFDARYPNLLGLSRKKLKPKRRDPSEGSSGSNT